MNGPSDDSSALSRESYEKHLPLVRRVAMRTAHGAMPEGVGYDDILREGFRGLASALRRKGSASESEFEAYAAYRIRLAVLEFLRLRDPHARKMREASLRICQVIRDHYASHEAAPSEAEVGASLGLNLEDYRNLLSQIAEAGWVRLEIGQESSKENDSMISSDEVISNLGRIIRGLPEQYQVVLGLYYQEQCSHGEIADILGLGAARACQLHAQAVHLVRGQMQGGLPS